MGDYSNPMSLIVGYGFESARIHELTIRNCNLDNLCFMQECRILLLLKMTQQYLQYLLVTDTIQVRTITLSIVTFQSGSALYQRTKLGRCIFTEDIVNLRKNAVWSTSTRQKTTGCTFLWSMLTAVFFSVDSRQPFSSRPSFGRVAEFYMFTFYVAFT